MPQENLGIFIIFAFGKVYILSVNFMLHCIQDKRVFKTNFKKQARSIKYHYKFKYV